MERCVLACLFLLLVHASAARADSRAATEALTAVSADRSAASSGAAAAADWLEREIRIQTGNAPVFRQKFLITVPASLECRAEARDAAALSFPLAPLLPMGGQPPSLGTPGQREFPLLYGRNGTLEDLRGKSLANALVALDISDPEAIGWKRCASLGAAGVIFLGDSQTPVPDFLNKSTMLPLGLPRFYCDDPAAVAWLKTADGPRRLALKLRTAWEERAAENLICILPARGTGDGINQWVVLQARYDAPSQVMTRAPGATTAFNAAALLQLAREIAAAPEHCGVVLVWTSGDQWNLRGTREFLDLLHRGGGGGRAGQAVGFLKARSTDAQQQASAAATILREARSVAAAGWPADPAAIKRAGPIIEEELLRQASAVETRLQRLEGSSPGPEAAALKTQKHALLQATNLANGSASDAPSDARALLQKAAATVVDKWQTDLLRLEAQRDALQNWPQIRAAMPGGDPQSPARPDPLLFLSLALTGGNAAQPVSAPLQWGLLSRSFYSSGLDATGPMSSLSIAFRRYGQLAGDRFEPRALENATVLESLLPLKCAFSSDAAIARGIPAAAFATLLDPNTFLDTPNDTLDHLDFAQLDAQEQALHRFLLGTATNPGLLSDPQLYARVPIPAQVSDQTITLYERAAGENLPRLKAAQALIGGESEVYSQPLGGPLAGTRRDEWLLTHADGTAVFHSLQRAQGELRLQAYEFDDAGTPLRALISNVSPDKNSMVASVFPSESHPVNAMLFEATRLDAYGLFDPRHLDILDKIEILDARRLDSARFLSVYAREGAAAIFMPPLEDMQWQLLAHRGNAGTRLVLLNADAAHPNGTGYQTTSPAALGSLRWRAAQDFYALDQKRKTELETFGISNEIIRDLQSASQTQLAIARDAEKQKDYPAFAAATDSLLAMQSEEYQTLINTSNGIIHGVIFLLLGVIPFSYFLERLLIGSPNVYKQIGWFAVFFVLMTFGLWFHPAFRISSSPLMILLAFFILILSSTVVYILWGKFEEEIKRLRGTGGEGGDGAGGDTPHVQSFQRAAVLGAAVRLGLSNMRRRAMRTTLTLLTLVLLTFTLLCFTSVRESVQISPHAVDYFTTHSAPPPGIFVRRISDRGWDELPPDALQLARGFALQGSDPAARSLAPTIAPRYWYASQRAEQPWQLPIQANAKTYNVSGLLGLAPDEAEFQPASPITKNLAADACWLPEQARDALQLKPGDPVSVMGFPLKVAGFFSQDEFSKLRCLSGDPVSPIDPVGQKSASTNLQTSAQAQYRFLSPISTAIIPVRIAQRLDARLMSISFRPAGNISPEKIEALATSLAKQSVSTLYASTGTRVLAVNAAESSRPQDLSTVIVPIIIAGIIVLNTMLGAVSERTREIHVYTSVGLSPIHVGMLFLAEAAALGTLGIVFGYIFGQGLATLLSWTHLLSGVDLNYSSMSAIFTMGLVLSIVMLSSLWPAHAASRLATPSLQRDWKLPRPVGDLLLVDLPFTVNESAARGTLAFVAEFLNTTTTAGTGKFTADQIAAAAIAGTQGTTRTLSARIWLAPFDLGVIQTMSLSIHPTDQPHVFDVHVRLTREAGNPASWRRLNRPFLTEIRRQFLLWRALDPKRVGHYVRTFETLLP